MVDLQLDEGSAHVRAKNGMNGVFFAGEDLLYGADFFADDHVEVAVVDGRANGSAVAVVVGLLMLSMVS